MKIARIYFVFALILFTLGEVKAQIVIPKNYFASPLNISLAVNGSFGEVRPNHFHSGMDFPVQQKEGLPVFAVADGFVSRVKVSPVGFGKALYIDHPNGFTSVYAHLKTYNNTINTYVYDNQYKTKSFDVDLFPANNKQFLYVKKGDVIGYAGNSGSSGGPHLHFEMRNTKTESTINPNLFDFKIIDNFPPYFDFIKIYPETDQSFIGSSNAATRFNVKKTSPGKYALVNKDTLSLWGDFSIGAQAFDYHHNQSNRNGYYSLKMLNDNVEFFSMVCDSFAFNETRYVNALLDYADNYNNGSRIVKSKKLPGNKLSLFKTNNTNGILHFVDNTPHQIMIEVGDLAGNISTLKFWVVAARPQGYVQVPVIQVLDSSVYFRYDKSNSFENNEISIEIPPFSLYENIDFQYSKSAIGKNIYSSVHKIHIPEVPLQNKIKVSIKATRLPERLRSKALLVRIDREGKRTSAGGAYANGYVTTTTNSFDSYAIVVDTVAPTIVNISGAKPTKSLRFTVSDNFSGIETYRGELNGEWALVEWDPKNRLMQYVFDSKVKQGKNDFVLFLADAKGNKSSLIVTFIKAD